MQKGLLALLFLALCALCVAGARPAAAQDSARVTVEEIEAAYRQIEYERAEALARSALQNYGAFTVSELADVHSILALIAYNRGQQEEARRQFLSALQLAPAMELDPALVPPKIVTYFEDLKAELAEGASYPTEAALRYILVRDQRLDAALRSMVVPGWGQFYKGQPRRAGLYAGLFGITVGGALLFHFKMNAAHDRYEDAASAAEAERLYEPYNRFYQRRNGLAQGAVIVWAASYIDALLTRVPNAAAGPLGLHAAPNGLVLQVEF